jgi:alpha-L-fucosidase
MTRYGHIDIVFLDGMSQWAKTELAKVCWEINPEVVVTRGAIPTPEQKTPDTALPSPWEACYTLGDQWQYRPTNETYKSARTSIEKLIEIRAKGGNFLLNFGPDAQGNFPPEQLAILNEMSLWMFINREAFEHTEPHQPIREGNLWFLMGDEGKTAYVFILEDSWEYGKRKKYLIQSFKAGSQTRISVLGHNGNVLEYQKEVDPSPTFRNTDGGLEIDVMRAQRIYNDRKWNNPLVVKLEEIEIR